MKHPIPSRTTDALIGDEEQNGKQKISKERNGEWVPNTPTLDHLVESYDSVIYKVFTFIWNHSFVHTNFQVRHLMLGHVLDGGMFT